MTHGFEAAMSAGAGLLLSLVIAVALIPPPARSAQNARKA